MKKFKETERKVVDYDKLTGNVRGIAHNYCTGKFNLDDTKIPIFFHNFKGYDSHYIVKELGEFINEIESEQEIQCIMNNREKMMSQSILEKYEIC